MVSVINLSIMSVLLVAASAAGAEVFSFEEIWRQVSESSPAQEGARLRVQSSSEGLSRVENHWLPKVYLEARSYSTNDPGSSFFGLLEQRKVETADFATEALNHPDARTYTRGALGLDLALYEGGIKTAQVEMYGHMAEAEKWRASQVATELYAQTGLAYGTIGSAQKQGAKLKELNNEVAKLVREYRLGQKANPVGYSGLLGMKSLANRIAGLIEQLEAQEKASFAVLKEMGVREKNWTPKNSSILNFVERYSTPRKEGEGSPSYRVLAEEETARAALQASKMEKARRLPKVGAFAESYVFNGSRASANGYTAGLYLQWSLFDPADYGKFKESQLASRAAEKFSQASTQQEKAERESLLEADKAIRSSLMRLEDSDKLLSEQMRVSSTLFKNGSINALQSVEILNRRTDLISQLYEVEISLLKNSAERIKKLKFENGEPK